MRNILKEEWVKGNVVPTKFVFVFKDNELITFGVNQNNVNELTPHLTKNLFDNLFDCGMFSFFEDISEMVIHVLIHKVKYEGKIRLCIETNHYNVINNDFIQIDRECDCVIPISDFFETDNEICEFNKPLFSTSFFSLN